MFCPQIASSLFHYSAYSSIQKPVKANDFLYHIQSAPETSWLFPGAKCSFRYRKLPVLTQPTAGSSGIPFLDLISEDSLNYITSLFLTFIFFTTLWINSKILCSIVTRLIATSIPQLVSITLSWMLQSNNLAAHFLHTSVYCQLSAPHPTLYPCCWEFRSLQRPHRDSSPPHHLKRHLLPFLLPQLCPCHMPEICPQYVLLSYLLLS